jgi:hypothetical protein
MNRHDRLYASATATARQLGLLAPDETLLAVAQARISSYTSESGGRQSFPRPPAVWVGVSASSLFAFDRKGFTCRGYLSLVTHASIEFDGMTFQWATPRETTACLSVQDMPAADEFWSIFKHMRDRAWAEHPRDKQVTLTWFSGSRPGVFWINQPGVSLEEFHRRQQAFIDGAPAAKSPRACALVDSPVSRVVEETHAPAPAPSAAPPTARPRPKRR